MKTIKASLILLLFLSPFFIPDNQIYAAQTSHQFERILYMSNAHLEDGLQSLTKNAAEIDVVAPQAYTITNQLIATGSVPYQIEAIAVKNMIKIMPLITNQGFSQSLIHNFLASEAAQQRVIDVLVQEAVTHHYIGWQFDIEHIISTDRDLYTTFVERAARTLHDNGLILSIAAVARTDDVSSDFFKNWSGVFDYQRLASSTAFISIMTYDDPDSTGPAASLSYVKKVTDYLIGQGVQPNKISLGIPFYYWGWDTNTGKKVRFGGTYTQLQDIRKKYKPFGGFSAHYQVPYLVYSIKKHTYIAWYENAQSIRAKLDLMKAYKLRGFSAWVLGLEDPGVWVSISQYK